MHKLVILRGNSGSGKTTVAKDLQRRCGRNTMVISQDVIRRDMLYARDGTDSPAIPLMKELLAYGFKHHEVVIMEGILNSKWYLPLFELALELYGSDVYAYYFDIPFEETVRRHQTRPICNDFGAEEMREWWVEKDFLDILNETTITENDSCETIVQEIFDRITG